TLLPPIGCLNGCFSATPTAAQAQGSAHNPFLDSRAFCSSSSSTVFPGAYFRSHQHQPSSTSVWLTLVPSSRSTSARVRPYLSWPWGFEGGGRKAALGPQKPRR